MHIISPIKGYQDINNCNVLSMKYEDPKYPEGHIFEAKLLPGAKFPERVISKENFEAGKRGGYRGGYRGGRGNFRGNNRNWKPRIGFNPNRSQASLSQSGHRHLNHHLPSNNYSGQNQNNYHQGRNHSNNNYQGGYQNNQRGGYQNNQRGGYQGNQRGGYQGNQRGGYQGNQRGGYQNNQRGGGYPFYRGGHRNNQSQGGGRW